MTARRLGFFAVVFASFALYLHTMGPSLVPYRDAGEMSTAVTRLGVLHPPGYPLYTLLGYLFTELPIANPAYRLTLLSAFSLAVVWGVLFLLACELWSAAAAAGMVLLGMVSFQFWMHAIVPEMNTLNLLIIGLLLWLVHRGREDAAVFLFGLGLGVRMDLLLCAPAFLVLSFDRERPARVYLRWAVLFFLGFSVFFYLWIRAAGRPLLNWADPSTLERFVASITRRSYGSTLDLLSQSYRAGENFAPQFALYVRHLGRDFTLLSFPLALAGLLNLWKTRRRWFGAIVWAWLFTGPLFIYLGNLPTNPHAVAIMEAAYLVPDLFYLLAIGAGVHAASAWPKGLPAVYALLGVLIVLQGMRFYPAISKRQNWFVPDFIRNIFYSVPEPSLMVARSDVPIFSLYYGHWISPRLKWRVPVAQGLSGSTWYQVMMGRQIPNLVLGPLKTAADWEALAQANPGWSLYGTPDVHWPQDLHARMVPSGLLMKFLPRGKASVIASDTWLNEYAVYRGRYKYDGYYEYFSPELIEEYAKAWMEWGRLLARSGRGAEAADAFRRTLSLKPDTPYAAFQIGYLYFEQNKLPQADYYYRWSVDNFRKMHRQADAWNSFPEVKEGLRRDEAQAMAHWGVIKEHTGDRNQAVSLYRQALEIDPACADARYNLAVIYWREQRWQDVVDQLQALAAAHPEDTRWRAYLPRALEKLKQ
jgi:hypothetical protein